MELRAWETRWELETRRALARQSHLQNACAGNTGASHRKQAWAEFRGGPRVCQAPSPTALPVTVEQRTNLLVSRDVTLQTRRTAPDKGAPSRAMTPDLDRSAWQHRRANWSNTLRGAAPLRDGSVPSSLQASDCLIPLKLNAANDRWANTPHQRLDWRLVANGHQ